MAGLLENFRSQNPEYNNRTDDELEDAIYKKYYSNNLSRAEFYNRLQARSVGQEIQGGQTVTGTAPVSGEVVQRGSVLPIGKTSQGNLVPALPEWAADVVTAIRNGINTGDLSPKDAMSIASIVAPDAKGVLEGIGGAVRGLRNLEKPSMPATAELKTASQAAYGAAEQAGVKLGPDTFREMVSTIIPDVKKAGFDKDIEPKAAAALRRFQSEIDLGNAQTLPQLDILRQVASSAAKSPDANERRISRIITGKMDEFLDNLKPEQVAGGDTKEGVARLKQARELWARQAKSSQIDEIFDKATARATGTHALGLEGQLRQQFQRLAENPRRLSRFSADEQAAIKKVAGGSGKVQEALVHLGKLSPAAGFFALILGGGLSIEALQNPKLLALPVIGSIARWGATRFRVSQANRVRDLTRGGKKAAEFFNQRSALRGQALDNSFGAGLRPGLIGGSSFMPDQSQ